MSRKAEPRSLRDNEVVVADSTWCALQAIAGASTDDPSKLLELAGIDSATFTAFVKAMHLQNDPSAEEILKAAQRRTTTRHAGPRSQKSVLESPAARRREAYDQAGSRT